MHLIVFVLKWALEKVAVFVALVMVVFMGMLLVQKAVPALRDAVADRDRLEALADERASLETDIQKLEAAAEEGQSNAVESVTTAVQAEVEEGRLAVSEKADDLERVREEHEICGWRGEVAAWVFPGNACDEAEAAIAAADGALTTVETNLEQAEGELAVLTDPELDDSEKLDQLGADGGQSVVEREIDNSQAELDQKTAEQESLEERQNSWAGWIVATWAHTWKWVVGTALLLFGLPALSRIIGYFVLMPLVTRVPKPIRLAAGSLDQDAQLRSAPAERTLTIHLNPGEVLSARSDYVRPVGGKARNLFLYDKTSPFISFASGLRGLSRITGVDGGTSAKLTAPTDPDAYLMRIDFADHPGVVMHPKHVVGIIGTPDLTTRWSWGMQSLATWQVRYILFAGTGSLLVQGSGDVVALNPEGGTARMDRNLVMGFDSRLDRSVGRTDVFTSYFRGRTSLVVDEFEGDSPLFWQKSTADGASNPIARTFDAFFSAVGKMFGF
ncbi:hypothetical protein EUA93_17050 [Nocardioides oleivorans]|uniref:Uncharacterized protein n=1 Tax=Nocardioides oleivorans TaxID=273676 RepID=A0A4Q2RVG9_9ACTN|nr:hypothetical protein [Nocardioides oleivorans]RYB91839.1 hypothetical protein EUA93_17050 [Nocardioides oleivorans]